MAPLPTIANVYRVALDWTTNSGPIATNVLHFLGAPGSAAGLYTSLNNRVLANMWLPVTSEASVSKVVITPLDGSTASTENSTGNPAKWSGTAGSSGMPAVAALIKLRTAKRGVSYRGRIFLPWVAENIGVSGFMVAENADACTAAWTTFRTNVASDGYTLRVASYTHSTSELVTTAVTELALATQRRRQTRLRT